MATMSWANAEGAEPAATPDTVAAVWLPQDLLFKFDSPTPRYTCEMFRDKVKSLLRVLGARSDLQVESVACVNSIARPSAVGVRVQDFDGPSAAPQVAIKMRVLKVPVQPVAVAESTPAHWRSIDLVGRTRPLQTADCTLAKQVTETLIPLFTTRNVDYSSTRCDAPRWVTVRLRLDVLVTEQK